MPELIFPGPEGRLEGRFQPRPLLVEHRIPCRVAVFTLHHHVLPEQAFMREAEARGGAFGRLVAVVGSRFNDENGEIRIRIGETTRDDAACSTA